MRKLFKIILSVVLVVLLLVIVAALVLPVLVDPNHFKPEIVAAVKEKTGRDLELDGDLKLSVFPWLGVSTGKMVLGNAQGFKEKNFVTVEESDLQVKLMPLLDKKLEVNSIVLKGLRINLIKNQQGVNNWEGLAVAKDKDTKQSPKSKPMVQQSSSPAGALEAFVIGGIAVEDAQILWQDLQKGRQLAIKNFNFNTGQSSFDQSVPVELSMLLENPDSKFTEDLSLKTSFTLNEKLDTIAFSDTRLNLTALGEGLPNKSLSGVLSVSHISVDKAKQTAQLADIKLQLADINLSSSLTASAIFDKPSVQGTVIVDAFSPVAVMKTLAIKVPPMQDDKALTKMALAFKLNASADSASFEDLLLTLDDTEAKGSAQVKNYENPAVKFDLAINAVDINRYLAPKSAKTSQAPVSAPATATAAAASLFPVETLRKLNAEGVISLRILKVNAIEMKDIYLNLSAKNGVLSTRQTVKQFFQGSYSGNLNLDVRPQKPALSVDEKFNQISVEPLLTALKGEAKISGIADATAMLHGQGNTSAELKSSLNGNLGFVIQNGAIKGFNLTKMIDTGKALASGSALNVDAQNDETPFSDIRGTATLSDKVLQNNDLSAKVGQLRVSGSGTANMATEQLDFKIKSQLIKEINSNAGEAQYHQTPVGIMIGGTFSKPSFSLDVAAMLTEKNKAKVEKLIDKLDKKVGGGIGDLLRDKFNF